MGSKKIGKTGRLYSIEWSSPYTDPPDGAPRVLAEMFVPHVPGGTNQTPAEIETFLYSLGGGYCLYSRHVSPPPKGLSQETLAKVRRNRLGRRMVAKVPMFAKQFIDDELSRKPDYYAGITDPAIEQRRNARIDTEHIEYKDYWSRPNELVVYGREPEACRRQAEKVRQEMQSIRERFARRPEVQPA